MAHPLKNNDGDYILRDDHEHVWIEVGHISVYIRKENEGVKVELVPRTSAEATVTAWVANPYKEDEGDTVSTEE